MTTHKTDMEDDYYRVSLPQSEWLHIDRWLGENVSLTSIVLTELNKIKKTYEKGRRKTIQTGIASIDAMIGGLCPGELLYIGSTEEKYNFAVGLNILYAITMKEKTREAIMEQKKRVLIADNSTKFCDELTQALMKCGCYEIAGTVNDGEQAIKLVKRTEPDVLVLDMMLAKKDGIAVLKELNKMENRPTVIATSGFITDYVASASANLGVRYLMLKPCDVDALMERIEECCVSKRLRDEARKSSETKVEKLVTEILHDIGVPAHIKGYQYLREAIIIAAEYIDILDGGAKALYGQVAKIFQTTPSRVVRAMQHAIDVVWEKGDHVVIEKHCGYLGEKPGTTRFIEVLTDDVADKMRECTQSSEHSGEVTSAHFDYNEYRKIEDRLNAYFESIGFDADKMWDILEELKDLYDNYTDETITDFDQAKEIIQRFVDHCKFIKDACYYPISVQECLQILIMIADCPTIRDDEYEKIAVCAGDAVRLFHTVINHAGE